MNCQNDGLTTYNLTTDELKSNKSIISTNSIKIGNISIKLINNISLGENVS